MRGQRTVRECRPGQQCPPGGISMLSARLKAVAELVTPGLRIADIGTDHAYIPIWLVGHGICPSAIAMDVREGPLGRAKENIRRAGLEKRIKTRLSDGFEALHRGEVQSVVIAGMGGLLMRRILQNGANLLPGLHELILEPQSDPDAVRHFLQDCDYVITRENMILDSGKYYPLFRAVPQECSSAQKKLCKDEADFLYGRLAIEQSNPVLKEFLQKRQEKLEKICRAIENHPTENACRRLEELRGEIRVIESALMRMKRKTLGSGGH